MSESPRTTTKPDRTDTRRDKFTSRRGRLILLISLSTLITLTALVSTATLSNMSPAKSSRASLHEMTSESSTSNHRSRRGASSETPQHEGQGTSSKTPPAEGQSQETGRPDVTPMIGPVSQDKDLRKLPYIAPRKENEEYRLRRHPFPPPTEEPNDAQRQVEDNPSSTPKEPFSSLGIQPQAPLTPLAMPTPTTTFDGITFVESGCGCLTPDTDVDI